MEIDSLMPDRDRAPRIEVRYRLAIARRPDGDTWDVALDGVVLFTVEAATTSDAETVALAKLDSWVHALSSVVRRLTSDKMPRRPVRCAWCDYVGYAIFVPDDGRPATQGDDVASSVWRSSGGSTDNAHGTVAFDADTWYAQGHYGSSHFDMDLFRFVKNPPTEPADPVCDGCIQKRVDAGDLELISDNIL